MTSSISSLVGIWKICHSVPDAVLRTVYFPVKHSCLYNKYALYLNCFWLSNRNQAPRKTGEEFLSRETPDHSLTNAPGCKLILASIRDLRLESSGGGLGGKLSSSLDSELVSSSLELTRSTPGSERRVGEGGRKWLAQNSKIMLSWIGCSESKRLDPIPPTDTIGLTKYSLMQYE